MKSTIILSCMKYNDNKIIDIPIIIDLPQEIIDKLNEIEYLNNSIKYQIIDDYFAESFNKTNLFNEHDLQAIYDWKVFKIGSHDENEINDYNEKLKYNKIKFIAEIIFKDSSEQQKIDFVAIYKKMYNNIHELSYQHQINIVLETLNIGIMIQQETMNKILSYLNMNDKYLIAEEFEKNYIQKYKY